MTPEYMAWFSFNRAEHYLTEQGKTGDVCARLPLVLGLSEDEEGYTELSAMLRICRLNPDAAKRPGSLCAAIAPRMDYSDVSAWNRASAAIATCCKRKPGETDQIMGLSSLPVLEPRNLRFLQGAGLLLSPQSLTRILIKFHEFMGNVPEPYNDHDLVLRMVFRILQECKTGKQYLCETNKGDEKQSASR